MTFFGKTLAELVASCTNNEYIEYKCGMHILYNENVTVQVDFETFKDWSPALAAVNGNRVLFPRDFSQCLKDTILPPYRHCDPVPCLREFKRKTQTTASLVESVIQFHSFTTGWDSRVVVPDGAASFVVLFNSLDVSEETDAAVLLFAFTLQKTVHCCDLKDPWGQLMKWREHCNAKLVKLDNNWIRIETKRRVEMVQLPIVVPPILVSNFNSGTPVPFEKFYSPEEVLKLFQRYYGNDKFISLFKDGLLSRAAVLP